MYPITIKGLLTGYIITGNMSLTGYKTEEDGYEAPDLLSNSGHGPGGAVDPRQRERRRVRAQGLLARRHLLQRDARRTRNGRCTGRAHDRATHTRRSSSGAEEAPRS